MYGRAKIVLRDGTYKVFKANDEDRISDFLYRLIGDSCDEELSGVPTFMEASSWCPMASIGDTFERENFVIQIID